MSKLRRIFLLVATALASPHTARAQDFVQQLGIIPVQTRPILDSGSAGRLAHALILHGVRGRQVEESLRLLAQSLAWGNEAMVMLPSMHGEGTILLSVRVGPMQQPACRAGGLGYAQAGTYAVVAQGGWCWQDNVQSWRSMGGQVTGLLREASNTAPERGRRLAEGGPPVLVLRTITALRDGAIQSSPSSSSTILAYLHPGTKLDITSFMHGGPWLRVRNLDGRTGYVLASIMEAPAPASSPPIAQHVVAPGGGVGKEAAASTTPAPVAEQQPAKVPATVAAPPVAQVAQPQAVPPTVPVAAAASPAAPKPAPVPEAATKVVAAAPAVSPAARATVAAPPPLPKPKVNSDL
jgi:hypothetical protein